MYKIIKYIVRIVSCIIVLVFLFYAIMGVSNLLFPVFKNISILISFCLCIGIIYYYTNLLEENFKQKNLLMKKDFQSYLKLINNVYNFDYSNLKIIKKIYYKDNKFCILIDNIEVCVVKDALLGINTQDDLIELDNILNKDILENRINLVLDADGYRTYVVGALELLR